MNAEMVPLQIIGLKADLPRILRLLRRVGCVQIDDVADSPEISARPLALEREATRRQEALTFLVARIDSLLELLGSGSPLPVDTDNTDYAAAAEEGVEELASRVQELVAQRDALEAELASLPRYESTLRKLLPLIPDSAHQPGNTTVGVLASQSALAALDFVARRVLELTAGRAEVIASDVDGATRAMLVVFPAEFAGEIENILSQEDVARLRLPAQLGSGPPDLALTKIQRRMRAIPGELEQVTQSLAGLAEEWCDRLATWRAALREEIETNRVVSNLGETDMTFVLLGWVPAVDFAHVERTLATDIGDTVFVEALPLTPALQKRAPIILHNPRPAQPFQSLVGLLTLPRYGHIDPTQLMALFMPIFFGMMLGDIGYGTLLLLLSLLLTRRFRKGVAHDVVIVLRMGAAWAIVFGFLYGEMFGTLGEHVGLHPLWFDRAAAQNISGLLIMTLAVGAAHVGLGLILGVWEAIRERSRSHLLQRGGMLLGLVSLLVIVAVAVDLLPDPFMTPAVAGSILGIVFLGASLGWLGLLMGPIEFIGLVGNVLSYLRIAAIGLASVYLAKVANDMVGMTGNVLVGIIIATLVHALNLVLGAFSPTIHSLRLHYVEFFRKFYEGGGRPFRPFKSELFGPRPSSLMPDEPERRGPVKEASWRVGSGLT